MKKIIFIILIILGLISTFLLISNHNNIAINNETINNNCYTTSNLTYTKYNHTTGQVTYIDSGIPIYNCD